MTAPLFDETMREASLDTAFEVSGILAELTDEARAVIAFEAGNSARHGWPA